MYHALQHTPPNFSAIRMIAVSQRGFTMIELMIVLAVTGVLMAIAMPDFARATRSIQLSHQAKEMAGAIKLARAEAIRRGQTVVMCRSNAAQTACNTGSPSAQWQNGWLIFVDLNNNQKYDSSSEKDGLIAVKSPMPTGVSVFTANSAQVANYIQFNPAGESAGPLSNTGTFRFSHDADNFVANSTKGHYYLIINRTGRVRVLNDDDCMLPNSGCLESD
jgi:type IV fimbrial biogenesis protein FimT